MTEPRRPLSPERLSLLKSAMQRQRRETKARGLPSERIDAEALLILQRFTCKCGCKKPLDLDTEWNPESPPPGYPVVAHEFYRRGKQSPGHVLGNVWWWRHECNAREAAKENVARGRGQRMEVKKLEAACLAANEAVEDAKDILAGRPSRKMGMKPWKPENYVSPLSKAGRKKVRERISK